MFCANCGKEIDEKAVICPNCGVLVQKYKILENKRSTVDDKNEVGIVGMVFSLVGILLLSIPLVFFVAELIGSICGCVGISRAKELNGKGKGFSIAAVVVSTIILLAGFAFTILSWYALWAVYCIKE